MQTTTASNYLGNISGQSCPTGEAGTQEMVWNGGGIEQYKMMLTDTTTQPYDTAYKWSQKYTVYDLLTQADSLRDADSLFSSWFDSTKNANIGLLHKVSEGLGKISGKGADVDDVVAYKDTLAGITPENEPETDLVSVLNIWADVLLDSSTVSPADSSFIAFAELDSTLTFATLNTRLDSTNYELVKEIANKCPYQFGHAVYIARGLAALNDTIGVVYQNSCETYLVDTASYRLDEQYQNQMSSSNVNKLYPNPTSNEVYLEYKLYEGETGICEWYNALGQKIVTVGNLTNAGILELKASMYSTGIYYVRLIVNHKTRNNWKISVIGQ